MTTFAKYTAPYNCDAVEISPNKESVFVGMYEYEESSSSREGGFLMMNSQGELEQTLTTVDYGCLDAKWTSDTEIVIACSDGIIRTYSTVSKSIVAEVALVDSPTSANTANILMTIDVEAETTAAISAKGQLSLLRNNTILSQWEAHSPVIESWTCALNKEATIVATGSDDCCLKFWDTRSEELIFSNSKSHRMGTTCIEFIRENEVLSGSYDDRIRKFDMRNLTQPIIEYKSIGGIWRMKPIDNILLVAACYGGCQVINFDDFTPIVAEYTLHESMAYGIGALSKNTAVSCSFYDKQILYWNY